MCVSFNGVNIDLGIDSLIKAALDECETTRLFISNFEHSGTVIGSLAAAGGVVGFAAPKMTTITAFGFTVAGPVGGAIAGAAGGLVALVAYSVFTPTDGEQIDDEARDLRDRMRERALLDLEFFNEKLKKLEAIRKELQSTTLSDLRLEQLRHQIKCLKRSINRKIKACKKKNALDLEALKNMLVGSAEQPCAA